MGHSLCSHALHCAEALCNEHTERAPSSLGAVAQNSDLMCAGWHSAASSKHRTTGLRKTSLEDGFF